MGLTKYQILQILQVKGLGRVKAFKICERAENIIIDSDKDLVDFVIGCVANKWISQLSETNKYDIELAFSKAESIVENSERKNIKILSYYDEHFPKSLKNIPSPPIILHFKGNYKILNDLTGVAIIGTRNPTIEGIKSGEFFGKIFGQNGFNVVSGLALGCDAAAHKGCLISGGITTAIVAHGLHTIYPKENKQLAEDIISRDGILLSEYPIGMGALSNYFVERDRLQSGLSKATIVIQTGEKGGTMHAVRATIENNKILAAVKYKNDILPEKIAGNNMLIQSGAYALTSDNFDDLIKKIKEDFVGGEPYSNPIQIAEDSPETESTLKPVPEKRNKKKRNNKKDSSNQYTIGL